MFPGLGPQSTVTWDVLRYDAAPGEANDTRVSVNPHKPGESTFLTVADATDVTAGPGCKTVDAHTAMCSLQLLAGSVSPAAGASDTDIKLGDGDDKLAIELLPYMKAVADGGDGNDELTGSTNAQDTLRGGAGDDRLNGHGTPPSPGGAPQPTGDGLPYVDDALIGGPGADMLTGGPGTTADYSDHTGPVHVDLEGDADDGSPGEGDTVAADVTSVTGGSGDDEIAGNDGPNHLNGGPGSDHIDGLGGFDNIVGGSGKGKDRIDGGAGHDVISAGDGGGSASGGAGDDYLTSSGGTGTRLLGGPGADQLFGSGAADVIDGGPGSDHVEGLGGADRIVTRDGAFDFVQCGESKSVGTAILDGADFVKRCKRIERRGAAVAHGFSATLGLFWELDERLPVVGPRLGCPQDFRSRCTGSLQATLGGRVIGKGRFSVPAGRIGHGRIPVGDAVDKAVKRDQRARVKIVVRTRDSAGKKRTLRMSILYTGTIESPSPSPSP